MTLRGEAELNKQNFGCKKGNRRKNNKADNSLVGESLEHNRESKYEGSVHFISISGPAHIGDLQEHLDLQNLYKAVVR